MCWQKIIKLNWSDLIKAKIIIKSASLNNNHQKSKLSVKKFRDIKLSHLKTNFTYKSKQADEKSNFAIQVNF